MDKASIYMKCNLHHPSLQKHWLELVYVQPMSQLLSQHPLDTQNMRQKDDINISNFNYKKDINLPYVQVNPVNELSVQAELKQMSLDTGLSYEYCNQFVDKVVDESHFLRLGLTEVPLIVSGVKVRCAMVPKGMKSVRGLICNIPKRYVFNNQTKTVEVVPISIERLLYANAVFSSQTFMWLFNNPRRMGASLHGPRRVAPPMPQPSDEELSNNTVYRELVRNSALLTLSFNFKDFGDVAERLKIDQRFLSTDVSQLEMLQIRNNSLIADLYKLSVDEIQFMKMNF